MAKDTNITGLNEMETKIAEMICELNVFETPTAIKRKVGRDLNKAEYAVVSNALEAIVPRTKWQKFWKNWRNQYEGATTIRSGGKLKRVA